MGKASRIKNAKLAVAELKREQQEKEAAAKKRQKKINILTAVLSSVAAVIFIASIVIINFIESSGYLLRRQTVLKSNNLSVSAATFTYFFNYEYQNFINNNSQNLTYYGLDVNTSLRAQEANDGTNWFDYFANNTKTSLEEILYLSEKAKALGIKLDDEENKQLEDFFVNLKEGAEQNKVSVKEYIATVYGEGVNEDDIRKGLELSMLATKFYDQKINSTEYSDTEISNYFNNNKNKFQYVDYKYYTFTPSVNVDMSEDEKQVEYKKAEDNAARLMKAKNAADFDKILTEILKEENTTDTNIETALSNTVLDKSSFDEEFEVSKWAFGDKSKANDTYLYKNDKARSVYLLVKKPYRDETETRSVRHILVSADSYETDDEAKKQAEKILKEFNDGDKTAESFGALATKYSEDTGSVATGGLYENFSEGEMVKEFNDWSFDKTRKAGDTSIVKTDYGYHVMYYVSKGDAVWVNSVTASLKDDAYKALYDQIKKEFKVTFNEEALDSINEIRMAASTTTTAQ